MAAPGRLHVPGVAEADAALVGALVAAVLQADDALARLELLLREVADVLVGLLRPDARLAVVAGLKSHGGALSLFVRWTLLEGPMHVDKLWAAEG